MQQMTAQLFDLQQMIEISNSMQQIQSILISTENPTTFLRCVKKISIAINYFTIHVVDAAPQTS